MNNTKYKEGDIVHFIFLANGNQYLKLVGKVRDITAYEVHSKDRYNLIVTDGPYTGIYMNISVKNMFERI